MTALESNGYLINTLQVQCAAQHRTATSDLVRASIFLAHEGRQVLLHFEPSSRKIAGIILPHSCFLLKLWKTFNRQQRGSAYTPFIAISMISFIPRWFGKSVSSQSLWAISCSGSLLISLSHRPCRALCLFPTPTSRPTKPIYAV